jgi:hopanoid C-2 methylase
MMDAIKTLNNYGLEVVSGIILGLDTDSDDTEARLKEFIDLSNIPMLTINLLQALPKTALWDRLKQAGRLNDDPERESNVTFLRPYDEVVAMWQRSLGYANHPERLFERFRYQVDATYANRFTPPARGKLNWANLRRAAVLAYNVLVQVGLKSDYRRAFRRAARHALRRGQIEAVLSIGFMAHHMIQFTREALRGDQNASFYSTKEYQRRPIDEAALPLRKSA